jgi:ArsR family transcriptional regulator
MQITATIFKALADETRLRILALLLAGELCVCEIIAALELPQSTISRHLACLRKSGWVLGRRQGTWMYYRFNDGASGLIGAIKPLLKKDLTADPGHAAAVARLQQFKIGQSSGTC